ncbi:hypothetical protein FRX31_029639 [Thalictrum thalictroides]|uniref:Uncharacterized protein n=1 Tax=Thalictrum thalictroides TaxID=46969 RepID=A0A7J6V761_THATH|nr:hypothetical protein FRX31_029639 [Thalictrum thalictroides]
MGMEEVPNNSAEAGSKLGTIGDENMSKHGLGQFHNDTLKGAYGLHSPTRKDSYDDSLLMLLKGKNVQEGREHIQFGSLHTHWEQRTWAGV